MPNYDILIRGARIVDGTGNPYFYGDVALTGDRIAAVAPPRHIPADTVGEVIEAAGKVVCPGFIDLQSHSLMPFLTDGRSVSKVAQGVTTEIMGELWTPVPFGGRRVRMFGSIFGDEENEPNRPWTRFRDWMDFLSARGVSVNFGSFVGGATVREYARGWEPGEATSEETDQMCRIVAEAMEEGAFGVATALLYPPNAYAGNTELTRIARVIGKYNGVYITHIRSEGDRLFESIDETIQLSRDAHCPVEIYHLKATGERNWPKIPGVLARIDAARASGVDVTADMYPYAGSGTGLNTLLPDWASENGKLLDNLRDPAIRARIYQAMVHPHPNDPPLESAYNPTRSHVLPIGLRLPAHQAYLGLRLPEIAALRGQDWAETTLDLLHAEQQRISTIFFSMNEDNVRLQLQQPWIKVSSDAPGLDPQYQNDPVHPRAYGTFTRVLGKYVREEKTLPLEDAVRKMTSAVAARLGLPDRGLLRPGFFADVVLFDPDTVQDRATFTAPHQLSVGIENVWVNGVRVLRDSVHTGAHPGRAVYGAGRS